jgi:hypothetical protein
VITVHLTAAVICFATSCHPVIVGRTTEPGRYGIDQKIALDPRYGGLVLEFDHDGYSWTAIHRTWPGREHLYAKPAQYRRTVTDGCVNVQPEVFDQLVTHLRTARDYTLEIHP